MKYMDFNVIQKDIEEFVELHNLNTTIPLRILDVITELGELSKEFLIQLDYKDGRIVKSSEIIGELGDVFFSLICVANSLKINIEESINIALTKYRDRMNEKSSIGSI